MPSLSRSIFSSHGLLKAFPNVIAAPRASSPYSTTLRTLSAQPSSTSQIISETAKQEGGTSSGSQSARMQSQVGKAQNFEQVAQDVAHKMQTDPGSVTSEDANLLKSREARATGQAQPPKDSISADAQRLASANERGAQSSTGLGHVTESMPAAPLSPSQQSRLTKEQNFKEAANEIGTKVINNPDQVTKADGDLLHSREQRAQGHTEKGGIAAQAQKLASDNAAKGVV